MSKRRNRGGKASSSNNTVTNNTKTENINKDASGVIGMSSAFAQLNHIILRDLNSTSLRTPTFVKYTKSEIVKYLSDPYKNQKNLQDAVKYIYGASTHFRRIIQYFVGLTDFCYIITPYKIDPRKANKKITNNNYRQIIKKVEFNNKMYGVYAGTVDTKKLSQDELNWLVHK